MENGKLSVYCPNVVTSRRSMKLALNPTGFAWQILPRDLNRLTSDGHHHREGGTSGHQAGHSQRLNVMGSGPRMNF